MFSRPSYIARNLAEKAHEGQFRRDGETRYFNHVEWVAIITARRGGTDEEIAAAYLHDTLEQTTLTVEDMRKAGIPETVIEAVKLLTLDKSQTYMWNIDRIVSSGNEIARNVKIADNLANLSDDPTDAQILKYAKSLKKLMISKIGKKLHIETINWETFGLFDKLDSDTMEEE